MVNSLCRLLFFLCAVILLNGTTVAPFAFAQTEQKLGILRDKIERLEDDISNWKSEAATIEDRAARYDKMAMDAQKQAEDSINVQDKEHWQDNVKTRRERAEALRKDAAGFLDKSKQAAIEIDNLKGQLDGTVKSLQSEAKESEKTTKEYAQEARKKKENTRDDDTCQFEQAIELVGLWGYKDDEDAQPFAIVQKDPNLVEYPNNLELHSFDRKWEGTFISVADLPQDKPRMVFKYKPQAGEMNSEIPDWVAAAAEGHLEWEIEILPECTDNGIPKPYAMFYPGEVKWSDDSQNYEILGRGKARRVDLISVNTAIVSGAGQAAIGVSVNPSLDPFVTPPDALIQHQRFHVKVRLPYKVAQKAGKTITATIEGLTGGESDAIQLKAGAFRDGRPVFYTHKDAVTIAQRTAMNETARNPVIFGFDWLFGNDGQRLDLNTENKEMIRVSYKDVSFELPIYTTWYQRGNDRFQQAAKQLHTLYSASLGQQNMGLSIIAYTGSGEEQNAAQEKRWEADAKAATKEAALKKRVRMLDNYQALMISDKLQDIHKYYIGMEYFGDEPDDGLLGYTEEDMAKAEQFYADGLDNKSIIEREDPINPLMKAALEGMTGRSMKSKTKHAADDIVWASPLEERNVKNSINNVSYELRKGLVEDTLKTLSYGMYQGVAMGTGTDFVYLAATGKDIFGKKQPSWMQFQAILGISSAVVLKVAGPTAARNFAKRSNSKRFGMSTNAEITYTAKGSSSELSRNTLKKPRAPSSLTPNQQAQLYLEFEQDPPPLSSSNSSGKQKKWATRRNTFEDPAQGLSAQILKELNDEYDRGLIGSKNKRYLQARYPKTMKVIKDFSDKFELQRLTLPECQLKVLEWIIYKDHKAQLGADNLHAMMMDALAHEKKIHAGKMNPKTGKAFTRYGFRKGYDPKKTGYYNWMVRKVARELGYNVAEIKASANPSVTLNHIKMLLQNKARIKMGINLESMPWEVKRNIHAKHAISIESVVLNKAGDVKAVRFFDPNVSAILELPAKDFHRMIYKSTNDPMLGNLTVLY